MLHADKKRVGELMGTLIRKQYPNGANGVTFDELLHWDLWPSFIKLYSKIYKLSTCSVEVLQDTVMYCDFPIQIASNHGICYLNSML